MLFKKLIVVFSSDVSLFNSLRPPEINDVTAVQ